MAGFAVLVFAIGMLAITGIELVKGSPLNTSSSTTAQRPGGTSLGSVLGGRSGAAATETSTEKATATKTKAPSTDGGDGAVHGGRERPAVGRARPLGADDVEEPPRQPDAHANPRPGRAGGVAGGGVVPNAQGGGEAGDCCPAVAVPSGAIRRSRTGPDVRSLACPGSSRRACRSFEPCVQDQARRRAASAAAAARGSSASVIARTTTTRRAPAASTSSSRAPSMPPIANHGRAGAPAGDRAHEVEPRRRSARLRRGRPARSRAEVVDPRLVGGRRGLCRAVRRAAHDHRRRPPPSAPTPPAGRPARGAARPRPRPARRRRGRSPRAAPRAGRTPRASTSSAASSSRASSGPSGPLSRSCTMSTPPASAASANSARSPRSRRAPVHR